jgi:hypothetical protein
MGGRGSYKADSRVDEFCNYVGPDLESEDDSDSEEEQQREEGDGVDQEEIQHDEEEGGQSMVAFVLHKDNKYYPTAWWWGSLVQWEVCHFGGGWVWGHHRIHQRQAGGETRNGGKRKLQG